MRLQKFCLDIDLGQNGARKDCLYLWKGIYNCFLLLEYDVEFETRNGQKHMDKYNAIEAQTEDRSIRVTCMRKES